MKRAEIGDYQTARAEIVKMILDRAPPADVVGGHAAKALKKQAAKAQLVAQRSADAFVAEQMSTLAQAFRAQAEVLKRKRKKKK